LTEKYTPQVPKKHTTERDKVIILRYSPKRDFKLLIDLVRDFFNHQRELSGKKQTYSRKRAIQTLKKDFVPSAKNIILVAKDAGKIIGFMRAQDSDGAWFLREIMVTKKNRNRGIGRKLAENMLNILKRKRVPAAYMQLVPTNIEALTFFTDLGINRINTIELESRLDKTKLPTHGKIKLKGFSLRY